MPKIWMLYLILSTASQLYTFSFYNALLSLAPHALGLQPIILFFFLLKNENAHHSTSRALFCLTSGATTLPECPVNNDRKQRKEAFWKQELEREMWNEIIQIFECTQQNISQGSSRVKSCNPYLQHKTYQWMVEVYTNHIYSSTKLKHVLLFITLIWQELPTVYLSTIDT